MEGYLDVPGISSRALIWVIAQQHLYFAALILGAPMFITLCEYLGHKGGDKRYERLAHDMMKVVTICYSFTAITGAMLGMTMAVSYQSFSQYLFTKFAPMWPVYLGLVLVETVFMYLYWYTWDTWTGKKKGKHIFTGLMLNIVGTLTLLTINPMASYMLTPPHKDTGFWSRFFNESSSGLDIHRLIANIVFGGFLAGLFAAFMYLTTKDEEEKAFYDWMGYTGALIGIGAFMVLPLAGYVLAKELFLYSASISTFLMADKEGPYFVMQGLAITLILLCANYYMWVMIERIEGGARFLKYRTRTLAPFFLFGALWLFPANFMPSMDTPMPKGWNPSNVIAPDKALPFTLMMPKAMAVCGMLVLTFMVYNMYLRAMQTGRIEWGKAPVQAPLAVVAVSAITVWLMALMGSIRELALQGWYVLGQLRDTSPYSWTPGLNYDVRMVSLCTLIFFSLLALIFWIGFLVSKKKEVHA